MRGTYVVFIWTYDSLTFSLSLSYWYGVEPKISLPLFLSLNFQAKRNHARTCNSSVYFRVLNVKLYLKKALLCQLSDVWNKIYSNLISLRWYIDTGIFRRGNFNESHCKSLEHLQYEEYLLMIKFLCRSWSRCCTVHKDVHLLQL